ncbi:MAG: M48 family metallopeptidase [Treponema sp.]|nr:M48 family metallopeptidase [Treponema sp.]
MTKTSVAYSFVLSAIPVEVEYRNVKVIRLTVHPPGGRVGVTAPPGTARDTIEKFAASKIKWIEKHRERFLNNPAGTKLGAAEPLRNRCTVYVWGVGHELELVERRGNSKIVIKDGRMTMYVPPLCPKIKKQEILDRWYRRTLKEAATAAIKKWEAVIGVEVKKLYVRKMKSHWGSCNYHRQTLRLNSELAKRNPEYLDYVVVHEILHIIERGHNQNFYRLLNQYVPAWKAIRKKMNSGAVQ